MNEVVELFGYITCACGEKFQVLVYDDQGNPIYWDQEATNALFQEHYATCPKNPDYKPTEEA